MKLAILYEDGEIFVSYTPEEFIAGVEKWITQGKTLREAMDEMVKELKRRTLTK